MEDMSKQRARDLIKGHYTADYRNDNADSPDETRRDMNRAIMQALREDVVSPRKILHIGSGPQLLERVLLQSYGKEADKELLKNTFFVTADLADILPNRLKAQKHPNVSHVRTDGEHLPFAPKSFGMLVSNMAIDLMPRESFAEAAAALADGGLFVFTFHHPNMMRGIESGTKDAGVKEYVGYGLRNQMFFETEEDIRSELAKYQLDVQEISDVKSSIPHDESRWWFVRGKKTAEQGALTV